MGGEEILHALGRIAPTVAVRGNVDREKWVECLPMDARLMMDAVNIYVVHDIHDLRFDPAAAGFGVVISGHSHKPSVEERNGVLYLNPGSAGRRRFSLPVTLARLELGRAGARAELIHLLGDSHPKND